MEIKLVAFDSFSTRSMATFIKTDRKIFIDPSIAIGPSRYGLKPHPIELQTLETDKEKIKNLARDCDIIIITHYHWDHCPHPEDREFLEKVVKNKTLIVKDFKNKVNKSQKRRGSRFYEKAKNLASNVIIGDSKEFEFGKTYIKISNPVWHGGENSKLGFVNMVYIEYKNKSVLFGSDIQGIQTEKTKNEIIKFNPKVFILSGPPTYFLGYRFSSKNLEKSNQNFKEVIERTTVREIIIDHHLLRDLKWRERIKDVIEFSEEFGVKIMNAAEYLKMKPLMLEAKRKELWNEKVQML